MTLRILHLLDHLQPSFARTQAEQLAAGLGPEFDIRLVSLERIAGRPECLQAAERFRRLGVSTCALSQACRFDPLAVLRLRRLVHRWQPHLIHAWQLRAQGVASLVRGNSRLLLTIGSRRTDLHGWERKLQSQALRCADGVVVPSLQMDSIQSPDLSGWPRIVVAPGVECGNSASANAAARAALLAKFGLSAETRIIAAAGRMTLARGFRECVWSADILSLLFPDSCLLIFGDGPQRRRLEGFNRRLRGWAHSRFVGWQELSDWWPHVELFFHADLEQGVSQTLLEAMAAGVPVVASDTPCHRRFLTDNVNASLAAIDDRTSLARSGRRLMRDRKLAADIAEAGRQTAMNQFPLATMVSGYREEYRRTIESRCQ